MKTTTTLLAFAATALATSTTEPAHHKSAYADALPQIFNTAGVAINGTSATTLLLASSTSLKPYSNSTSVTTYKSKSPTPTVTGTPLATIAGGSGSGSGSVTGSATQPSSVPHSGANSEMFGGILSGFKGWVLSAAVIAALAV